MDGEMRCQRCAAPLTGQAVGGLCAKCLLNLALQPAGGDFPPTSLAPEPDTTPQASGGAAGRVRVRYFGDYELMEEIARGGMGVVYKARQVSLNRIVALKMILAGDFSTPAMIERFQTEAEAAARLEHPNIVPIYEIGTHDGHRYFSMRFLEGGTLTQALTRQKLTPRIAAELMVKVVRAVHHAHQRGILHRDLKPGNILLDAAGEPHVADFGLAKLLEHDSALTQSAAVMGTPAYMAPEQAEGRTKEATTAVDIYSLGAIFYELLTGRPPFTGASPLDVLMQVREREPASPQALKPELDRDVAVISLKCLEKRPDRRYGSAEALAEDLERWLAREPIHARRSTAAERAWMWAKRKPAIASLAALLVVSIGLGLPALIWQWKSAVSHSLVALDQTKIAKTATARAEREKEEARHLLYIANMNLAQQAWEGNNMGRLRQLLEETQTHPLRGFEWYYWRRQTNLAQLTLGGREARVLSVAYSPDGRRIATTSIDKTATVWETATGRKTLTLRGHNSNVTSVDFSPDGRRIVTGSFDNTARVWDAATGHELFAVEAPGFITSVAFSPDGQRILTGNRLALDWLRTPVKPGVTLKMWEAGTGRELFALGDQASGVATVAFSPDGQRFASGGLDGVLCVRESATGRELLTVNSYSSKLTSTAFSPDNQRVATTSDEDQTIKIWEVSSGRALLAFTGHSRGITAVDFSKDGLRIATGSRDHSAKVWDAATGRELLTLKGHGDEILAVAFSPDGQQVVTGSSDRTAKVWDALTDPELIRLKRHGNSTISMAFSADGKRVVTGSSDGTAKVWDTATWRSLFTLRGHTNWVTTVAFSLDRQRIITGGADAVAKVWDATTGRELFTLRGGRKAVFTGEFSPDRHRIVIAHEDHAVKVWDADTGREVFTLPGHSNLVKSAVFSPDSRRIVTGCDDGVTRVWDAATGRQMLTFTAKRHTIETVRFSPNGQQILTGRGDGEVKVWQAANGRELLTLVGHGNMVNAAAFAPDGQRIVTASGDGTTKLWDAVTGRELLTFKGESTGVRAVVFSSDGQRIMTGYGKFQINVWEAANPAGKAAGDRD